MDFSENDSSARAEFPLVVLAKGNLSFPFSLVLSPSLPPVLLGPATKDRQSELYHKDLCAPGFFLCTFEVKLIVFR